MLPEMVSGPDMAAGYLFQLTREERSGRSVYVYHAQEGGSDAGGPPKDPIAPLGFAQPSSGCPFGGPRCWERAIAPVGADRPGAVRFAYNRFRFGLETTLAQAQGRLPVAIDAALEAIVPRLEPLAAEDPGAWAFEGRTAAWLRGVATSPTVLEILASPPAVERIAERLEELLTEPAGSVLFPVQGSGGAAFVGPFRDGVRVVWRSAPSAEPPGASDRASPTGAGTVPRKGHAVPARPLEASLVRAIELDDGAAVRAIWSALREGGRSPAEIGTRVEPYLGDPQMRSRFDRWLAGSPASSTRA
jgi:hypothetical protein